MCLILRLFWLTSSIITSLLSPRSEPAVPRKSFLLTDRASVARLNWSCYILYVKTAAEEMQFRRHANTDDPLTIPIASVHPPPFFFSSNGPRKNRHRRREKKEPQEGLSRFTPDSTRASLKFLMVYVCESCKCGGGTRRTQCLWSVIVLLLLYYSHVFVCFQILDSLTETKLFASLLNVRHKSSSSFRDWQVGCPVLVELSLCLRSRLKCSSHRC